MSDFDPYEAPAGSPSSGASKPPPILTIPRAFSIVILSTLGFGVAGMGVGYGLGVAAPAYYRTVFARGHEPDFDPVQVGLGLGLTQGLACGALTGLVVLLAVAMVGRRLRQEAN